jgi:hypothetical protein
MNSWMKKTGVGGTVAFRPPDRARDRGREIGTGQLQSSWPRRPKTAPAKIDFFRNGSSCVTIQSFSTCGSRSIFFAIFRVVAFFPSTQTAPVLRG